MKQEVDIPEEELLLPWYVSGQLSPEERSRVEAALARSPDLRLALDEERRLQAAVAAAPLPMPPAIDPDALESFLRDHPGAMQRLKPGEFRFGLLQTALQGRQFDAMPHPLQLEPLELKGHPLTVGHALHGGGEQSWKAIDPMHTHGLDHQRTCRTTGKWLDQCHR